MSDAGAKKTRSGSPADDPANGEKYVFKLYITGSTPSSTRAVINIRKLCEEYLSGRYDIEVIDIAKQPQAAKEAQLIVAPTLVKELPLPVRRFIGDMSKKEKLLVGLDIH